jgi:tetratricopeptide (TPR) repeat protein
VRALEPDWTAFIDGAFDASSPAVSKAVNKILDVLPVLAGLSPAIRTADWYRLIADKHEESGRYKDALAAYQQALALEPHDPFAHNNIAGVYMRLGRFQEAQQEYEERVRLRPDDALNALVHLGIIAYREGERDRAEANFTRALEIWDTAWERKPQSSAALLENKALALLGLNHSDEAMATLQKAVEHRSPKDKIDLYDYELFASAPQSPQGVDKVLVVLRRLITEDRAG